MTAMPTLFVSHGGPNVVIEDTPARDYLKSLHDRFPETKAIVIVSAHFETDGPVVVTDPAPAMIYDFGGFPHELYEMVYPAPGEPELAMRVAHMLNDSGLEPRIAPRRGFDHGVWNTLILGFPEADIPVVMVSIDPSRDATYHYRLGQALAPLREEGVLLVGSGHMTHNLRVVMGAMRHGRAVEPDYADKVKAFTGWFAERFAEGDREAILNWTREAPYVAENHPTDEHLMPLFFAYGAAGESPRAERVCDYMQYGMFAWDSWVFR